MILQARQKKLGRYKRRFATNTSLCPWRPASQFLRPLTALTFITYHNESLWKTGQSHTAVCVPCRRKASQTFIQLRKEAPEGYMSHLGLCSQRCGELS